MTGPIGVPSESREVLRIRPFRRLWISMSLSSLGDWLGLLALMALAALLAGELGPLLQYSAVSGVVVARLLPGLLLSPVSGWLADRYDRRLIVVLGDTVRGLLYASVPLVGRVDWLLGAALLTGIVSAFWRPARDVAAANLVPEHKRERAHRLGIATGYGAAIAAAAVLALLAGLGAALGLAVPALTVPVPDIALYLAALSSLAAAAVVLALPIPPRGEAAIEEVPVWRGFGEPWQRSASTPLLRTLLAAMLSAGAVGGALFGVARAFVEPMGVSTGGFAVLVGALLGGMTVGMFLGQRVLPGFDQARLFAVGLGAAAVVLVVTGLVPEPVLSAGLTTLVGVAAGISWTAGLTLVRKEAGDDGIRHTLRLLQVAGAGVLLGAVVVATLLAAVVGVVSVGVGDLVYPFSGAAGVVLLAGLATLVVAVVAQRGMVGRPERSLREELSHLLRGGPGPRDQQPAEPLTGAFVVLEGGEGAGKTTQVRQLAAWLSEEGFDVVTTREPGATKMGIRLRPMLLEHEQVDIAPRTEALLYGADRAEHIASIILPALRRGAIVISDRYVDSTLAYQGGGRELGSKDIEELNAWVTQGLVPDLTVVLDVAPTSGLQRHGRPADRIESESPEFHERVRRAFLELAAKDPDRYLVLDAEEPVDDITRAIQRRLRRMLPDPVPASSEAITGSFPAITDTEQ